MNVVGDVGRIVFIELERRGPDLRNMIRYDTRCYFNVRSKANTSQLNLPLGTDNAKVMIDLRRTST